MLFLSRFSGLMHAGHSGPQEEKPENILRKTAIPAGRPQKTLFFRCPCYRMS